MAKPFDNALKALWALGLGGLCQWLEVPVDGEVTPCRVAESLPPAASERVADLLATVGSTALLHLEAQTRGEARFEFRNLDYLVRIMAHPEFAGRQVHQHVILLGPGRLATGITNVGLRYTYKVHRVADEDPERFLADLTLLPFAPLGRMPERERTEMLGRVLELIAKLDDPDLRELLGQVTSHLAAVRISPATIARVWKESSMPIPSLYDIGREQGREQGLVQGREELLEPLLVARFGRDERIAGIALRLARLTPAESVERIEQARSLDELA